MVFLSTRIKVLLEKNIIFNPGENRLFDFNDFVMFAMKMPMLVVSLSHISMFADNNGFF